MSKWKIYLIVIGAAIVLAGVIILGWWLLFVKKASTVASNQSASYSTTSTSSTTSDSYGDWPTYINTDVGYSLRYPTGWTIKEYNKYSETYEKQVKYITITSAENNYRLTFGVIKLGDDSFSPVERTGIGAGDTHLITNMPTTIFGVKMYPRALVYEGKTKEFLYSSTWENNINNECKCKLEGFYGLINGEEDESVDLDDSDTKIPNKIISSVQWINE